MITDRSYWFLTTFERFESKNEKYDFMETGRCWGFFSDKQEAIEVLHHNETDLNEGIYDYAVLEEYSEGICGGWGVCSDRYMYSDVGIHGGKKGKAKLFFRYDEEKDGFFEIERPESLKDFPYLHFAPIG